MYIKLMGIICQRSTILPDEQGGVKQKYEVNHFSKHQQAQCKQPGIEMDPRLSSTISHRVSDLQPSRTLLVSAPQQSPVACHTIISLLLPQTGLQGVS